MSGTLFVPYCEPHIPSAKGRNRFELMCVDKNELKHRLEVIEILIKLCIASFHLKHVLVARSWKPFLFNREIMLSVKGSKFDLQGLNFIDIT